MSFSGSRAPDESLTPLQRPAVTHPYRRFAPAAVERQEHGGYRLHGADGQAPLDLGQTDHALACLFDGFHNAAAVLQQVRQGGGKELDAVSLEAFALRLAQAGLLAGGLEEPLPVASASAILRPPTRLPLSSALPGTLAVPNLTGSLTALQGPRRGEALQVDLVLDHGPLLGLGRLLSLPLANAWSLLALAAAVAGTLVIVVHHRFEMGHDLLRLAPALRFVLSAIAAFGLVSALSQLARAAAIVRYTRSRPHFGITFGSYGIPHFLTDTSGYAEMAGRDARARIIGSVLAAQLMLFVLSVMMWLMFQRSGGLLPPLALQVGLLSVVFFLLLINPLNKREGYALLTHWLRVGNLREQALFALFSYDSPWELRQRPSRGVLFLYLGLVALYLLWIPLGFLVFSAPRLKAWWGPAGPLLMVCLLAYFTYRIQFRASSNRSNIKGSFTVNSSFVSNLPDKVRGAVRKILPRSRWQWALLGAIVLLCLLPYPYQASGDFVVQPQGRADVRAQTAGEVHEVLVKEGDLVKSGQVIARLANDEQTAALASSQADIARGLADLSLAQKGAKPSEIREAEQAVVTAETRLRYSKHEADRQANAFKQNAVSEQQYQQYQSQSEIDRQQLEESRRHLEYVSKPVAEGIDAIKAGIAKAQAQLVYARQQLENTSIRAPITGHVMSGTLKFAVGDYLQRGSKLATIVDSDHLQLEIRIPEDDIGEIGTGAKASARVWSLPGTSFNGTISSIAPSAEEAPYGKVVRVYMTVDKADPRIRAEMTGYAKVRGQWHPLILAFTRPIVRFFLVEIWSWLP